MIRVVSLDPGSPGVVVGVGCVRCGGVGEFFDGVERARLCDLLGELGPDAPTLLGSWTARDVAAHLVVRERDPVAAPGLVVAGRWGRLAARRQKVLADGDFGRLTAVLRSGPPFGFFRLGWVRRVPSLNEFFVHHEDVRRAVGRGPRVLEPALDDALWHNVSGGCRFLSRRLRGVGLEVQRAGTSCVVRARRGSPVARLSGDPGELLLYLFGRRDAARVEVSGSEVAVAAVAGARFGL